MMAPDRQLTEIGTRMASVVDPDLRAKFTQRYLGLLSEWHRFPRRGNAVNITRERFPADVANLFLAVQGGLSTYKLTPALGTINDRFNRAYSDAISALNRLERLVEAQSDIGAKDRWRVEVDALREEVNQRRSQAEVTSSNANLSQLDALASQVQQYVAAKLIPRELEWRRRLGLMKPRYCARGESGVVAVAARPDLWEVGRGRKAAYGRQPGIGPAGNYVTRPGLSGDLLDSISQLAQGAWATVSRGVAAGASAKYASFENAVKRAAGARKRHAAHRVMIENVRVEDPGRADELQQNLTERGVQLSNIEAQLRSIAASLNRTVFDSWDSPGSFVKAHLGELDASQGAAVMLYAGDIDSANANLDTLEAADMKFERDAAGSSPAALAAGGGLALLAIAAAGAYIMSRRRG
jgi:hypothetical protein